MLPPVRSNFTQISFKCQNACCTNASNAKSGPPAINHHAQIFEPRCSRYLDTFAPLNWRVERQKPVDRHESNFWLQSTDLLTALRIRLISQKIPYDRHAKGFAFKYYITKCFRITICICVLIVVILSQHTLSNNKCAIILNL